jgi:hypothetical protein
MIDTLTQTCYVGIIAFVMFVGIPLLIDESNKRLKKHH